MSQPRPFLTAEWRHLVMLNFEMNTKNLLAYVPAGTELDLWRGRAIVSLVGFRFLKARLLGCRVPFHQEFAEVNLRTYVMRRSGNGWRRGVVFLREIVPKFAVAWIANQIFGEHFFCLPLISRVQIPASNTDRTGLAEYRWQSGRLEFELTAEFHGLPQPLVHGSMEEFIAEHYWGYTRHANGITSEYRVTHPPWKHWSADRAAFRGDGRQLYGAALGTVLQGKPESAMILDGSPVAVYPGQKLVNPAICEIEADSQLHSGSGLPLVSGASQMIPSPMM